MANSIVGMLRLRADRNCGDKARRKYPSAQHQHQQKYCRSRYPPPRSSRVCPLPRCLSPVWADGGVRQHFWCRIACRWALLHQRSIGQVRALDRSFPKARQIEDTIRRPFLRRSSSSSARFLCFLLIAVDTARRFIQKNDLGLTQKRLASTTFCWLPPDRVLPPGRGAAPNAQPGRQRLRLWQARLARQISPCRMRCQGRKGQVEPDRLVHCRGQRRLSSVTSSKAGGNRFTRVLRRMRLPLSRTLPRRKPRAPNGCRSSSRPRAEQSARSRRFPRQRPGDTSRSRAGPFGLLARSGGKRQKRRRRQHSVRTPGWSTTAAAPSLRQPSFAPTASGLFPDAGAVKMLCPSRSTVIWSAIAITSSSRCEM